MSNELDYGEIRRKVEEGLKKQKRNARIGFFIANLVMFIIFTLITWGVGLTNPYFQTALADPKSPLILLLILPTLGWGLASFIT